MTKYALVILLWLFSASSFAEQANIALEKAPIHFNDRAAVERGAKFFAANCMSCHAMVYLRHDRLAQAAGITYEKMPLQIVKWPNDVKPPDLSLEADVRGVDWIYTYLHSFYVDAQRPTGFNNLLVMNSVMPNILAGFQGQQILAPVQARPQKMFQHELQWYDLLILQRQGAMTPQQFDEAMTDVVSFLAYAAEPFHVQQVHLGWWVLGYLLVLFILVYFLKQAYWKQVDK